MGGYIGARAGTLSTTVANVQDVTATDTTPEVTIINNTHEDTDGGREGKVIFKGQQSGGEESTLAEIQGSHDGTADDEKGDLIFKTNDGSDGASPTEVMRIDSDGKVGIGTSSPTVSNGKGLVIADATAARLKLCDTTTGEGASDGVQLGHSGGIGFLFNHENEAFQFGTNNAERMRIDSSGNLLVGTTSSFGTSGITLGANNVLYSAAAGQNVANFQRYTSDGEIVRFGRQGTTVGSIGVNGGSLYIGGDDVGFGFYQVSNVITPLDASTGNARDNAIALGFASGRFTEVFAVNSNINTSDENEKQDIASLTSAEITAAKAISKLFKTYKWKDAVDKKGDNARTHTGVVAQQIQTAMSDAGLDASKYSFWCSDTWWETQTEVAAVEADEENRIEAQDAYTRTDTYQTKDEAPEGATERNRKGIRYPELLSFIGAATEQRLTSIEARLTALEAE